MASLNLFELLNDDENEDPVAVIARAASPKVSEKPTLGTKKPPPPQQTPAKLPTKPPPPSQAVKEAHLSQSNGRVAGGRGGRGGSRGGYASRVSHQEGSFSHQSREGGVQGGRHNYNNGVHRENEDTPAGKGGYNAISGGALTYGAYGDAPSPGEGGEGGRQSDGARGRGRGRGRGRSYVYGGDGEERPRRREHDRRSGTGRGNELKRDGAGRGNWGTEVDPVPQQESLDTVLIEEDNHVPGISGKVLVEEETNPESTTVEEKKEEEEDKEMTLDEYEKFLSEKRKALEVLKAQERKVTLDKDFESMQLVDRKQDDDMFMKSGSDKDKGKKKEAAEREEKAKKSVSINEFLKPAEGEEYYSASGRRGRGRGRSDYGVYRGGIGVGYGNARQSLAPSIEDPGQFPTLGGK